MGSNAGEFSWLYPRVKYLHGEMYFSFQGKFIYLVHVVKSKPKEIRARKRRSVCWADKKRI